MSKKSKHFDMFMIDINPLKCNICNNNYIYMYYIGITSEHICKNCILDEINKVLNEHRKKEYLKNDLN